uniref:Alpha/beta-hydrolase n=1 Tax=Globodera pallida TaxID=36090 RepID=A0A183BVZ5_GLOPA
MWCMEAYPCGDPRLPHHCFPPKLVNPDELTKRTGALYYKLDLEDQVALSKRIAIMKLERNFTKEDTYTLDAQSTIDFKEKIAELFEETESDEDQARMILDGSAYYDVEDEVWIRIFCEYGDLIIIPKGTAYRMTTTPKNFPQIRPAMSRPLKPNFSPLLLRLLPFLLVFVLSPTLIEATFSTVFRQFLRQRYGEAVDKELSREDVGGGGSFGGGTHQAGQQTKRRPVILVHGITNNAGTFGSIQHFFRNNDYGDDEVYGTTYGICRDVLPLRQSGQLQQKEFAMPSIAQIRMIVLAVSSYTAGKVNIIAYSMGSPIARKAIMGGVCVDTNEDVGPPLSGLVHTFVGVAGANWGSFLCVLPFGSCNLVNGMACGSRFLNDINSRKRYEGDVIYTIYSTGDDKVGYRTCGRIASAIDGENGAFQKEGLSHDAVIFNTANLQYNLVTHNAP